MFADTSLGARIDRAEGRLLAGAAAAIRDTRSEARTLVQQIGGGHAIYISPQSPANKVIGLGFDGPLDVAELEAVEREWQAREEPVRIELSILADPAIGPMLAARGYHLHGFENVLGQTIGESRPAPETPGLTIERVKDADHQVWVDVAVTAFLAGDGSGSAADDAVPREVLESVVEDLAAGWMRYIARLDGEPVGVGSLSIDNGLALVAGAGTLPEVRGRGIQKALLHRRLTDAVAAKCDLAVVTTAPGTRSQQNVMKRGFILLYTRAVLIKPVA